MQTAFSRRATSFVLSLLIVLTTLTPVLAQPVQADTGTGIFGAQTDAITTALSWLRGQQQEDGSFAGGFGSNLPASTQVLMALTAVGEEPRLWVGASGASLMDYLASQAATSTTDAGTAGRLAAALVMAGENPHQFGGVNLLSLIQNQYDPATGSYDPDSNIWNHALALWGLAAAHEAIPPLALTWLQEQQNDDGGWGWAAQQNSDTNSTALAVQALLGGGAAADDPAIARGISFLQERQLADGGFPYDPAFGPDADANSTAVVMQALLATGACSANAQGERICDDDELDLVVHSAMERLLAFQAADGAFEWQNGQGANLLATAQALPILAGLPFPQQESTVLGSLPNNPISFSSNTPLRGVLLGSRAGAFRFYALSHPGDGTEVIVKMTFTPDNPAVSQGLGFNLYGPGGKAEKGSPTGSPGERQATFSSDTPSSWLVQVYNYVDNVTLHFTLTR